jgi:hypothetical protein
MSSSKRTHTKSRLGCDQCKKRRIECDYIASERGRCSKKGLSCAYRAWGPAADRLQSHGRVPDRPPPPKSPPPSTPTTLFSLYDLGLLHDYTLRSSITLSRRDDPLFHDIWQQDVPKLALDHSYLMHGKLSFAAAYRSRHPDPASPRDSKAVQAARDHYDQALIDMRVSISDVAVELADPLLCFSVLISFVTLFLETDEESGPLEITVSLFQTIRSLVGIMHEDIIRSHLAESRIGALVRHNDAIAWNPLPQDLSDSLDKLQYSGLKHDFQDKESSAYNGLMTGAVMKLKFMFSFTTICPDSWDYLLSWPISLSSELPGFIEAIEHHEPLALCILAHWSVALCNASPKWYVKDWPGTLLETIEAILSGTKWERSLDWAMREVSSNFLSFDQSGGYEEREDCCFYV